MLTAEPDKAASPSPQAQTVHWPQLDGIRGFAIAMVVAYHLGYLPGGWIGVDVFFVLSGYLITTILLGHGGPLRDLGPFWGRRAKRLLPGVLVLLLAMAVYSWAGGPGLVPSQLRWPALATLLYGANWQQVIAGHSYFAQYISPGPLQHTWSLAIEEQYYLVWPVLLGGLLVASRSGRLRWHRHALLAITLLLASMSAVWMGVAEHLFGANRAYLGADTRAWELLIGGAAALAFPPGRLGRAGGTNEVRWAGLTVAGVAGVAAGTAWAGGPPQWVWDGGLVGVAVCAGLVIVGCLAAPSTPVARLLSWPPVQWVGIISYSLYLWHWPAVVLMTPQTCGLSGGALLVARIGAMTAGACASYYLVERPLRRADWASLARRLRVPTPGFAAAALVAVAAVIVAGTVGPARAGSSRVVLAGSPGQDVGAGLDLPPPSSGHPYRALILGDSVMFDGSLGLKAALEATGDVSVVANTAFPGWGLTTDPGWPADAARVMSTAQPQIALGTWSWDDDQAAAEPAAYLKRLEGALADLLAPTGGLQAVVLIQFPQAGPIAAANETPAAVRAAWLRQTADQRAWDRAAEAAAAEFPGRVLYLHTDQVFAPGGRYQTWFRTPDGAWLRGRKLDNTHLCPYGAALLGATVTQGLESVLHIGPMTPGWELGAWTRDRRYNDPAGACPADQPPSGYQGLPVA